MHAMTVPAGTTWQAARLSPRLAAALLFVLALLPVSRAHAVLLTATFTRGAIAEYSSNANQTQAGQLFGTLSISDITISQNSTNGAWGGTQGNDTAVNVVITFSNSATASFAGAINWVRNAGGGSFHWVGLTTVATVSDGYTTSGPTMNKTYILQFDQSALNLATLLPNDLDGSANAGQALSALNTYVPPPAISFTNTNATSGGQPSYSFSYQENRASGATLGTVSATGGAATLSYSITAGNGSGWFAINSSSGAVTMTVAGAAAAANDYETNPNSHTLTVQATDGSSPVTVEVALAETNVDDTAPVITGPSGAAGAANSAISVNENQTAVTQMGANEAVTWSISGGADAARFGIAANGTITFNTAPDFEAPTDADTNNTYVLIARALDGSGNASTQTVTVTVHDVDDTAPQITGPSGGAGAANAAISVNENQTAVTQFTASEAVTWSIVGGSDAARFVLAANGTLTFAVAPDFEAPSDSNANNTYVVTVQATDGTANSGTQTLTVTVLDVNDNDPPALITGPTGGAGAANAAISVNENQTAVTQMGANEAVTWSISGGADAVRFGLAADGTLTFASAPDFEAPTDANVDNHYVVVVQATDGSGNSSVQTLTVTVLDVNDNDPPALITGPSGSAGAPASAISVNENQTAVAQLTANEAVTWSLSGGVDAARFSVTANGTITFNVTPDFENPADADADNVYLLTARAVDGGGNASTQNVAVTVLDVDDAAPVISGPGGAAGAAHSSISVNENQTAVTQFTADEAVTWSISGGSDAGRFVLAADGTVAFATAPDFEAPVDSDANNAYVVTVQAVDGSAHASVQTLTVTVLDVLEVVPAAAPAPPPPPPPAPPPVITGPTGGPGATSSEVSLSEGEIAITQLSASKAVRWSITGGADAARFTITADGRLRFVAPPNFTAPTDSDGNNIYVVVVQVEDDDGVVITQTLTITILDLAEPDAAPVISGPASAAGAPASAVNRMEGESLVTQMAASEAVTWSIVGGSDAAQFLIGADGTVSFANETDYEHPADSDANNVYVVQLRATDSGGNTALQTLTATVEDRDEIGARLAQIAPALREGLRGHAFGSLHDLLSFNERVLYGAETTSNCAEPEGRLSSSADRNRNLGMNFSRRLDRCAASVRVVADGSVSASRIEGHLVKRSLAALRFERDLGGRMLIGAGLAGSAADDTLRGFSDSEISDQSLQASVYLRARLGRDLRLGAFGLAGRTWYDFSLDDEDFVLDGHATGSRRVYGLSISGDVQVGSTTVTTDLVVSRAIEKLGSATLDAQYLGESRSDMAFWLGGVDATRVSLPLQVPMVLMDHTALGGAAVRLVLSPGLLCEDTALDSSRLRCGYEIGARLNVIARERDRIYVDVHHEAFGGGQRDLFSVGLSHRFGAARGPELAVSIDDDFATGRSDRRAMMTLRIAGL